MTQHRFTTDRDAGSPPMSASEPASGGSLGESLPVSASVSDWSREAKTTLSWMPSRSLLAALREHEKLANSRSLWATARRKWVVLRHRFWSIVTGADIPLGAKIDGGLLLPHPNGVVIHVDAKVGPNCLIFQQVTIGAVRGGVPVIGGHVDIGAGAKVLGAVRIGDHALIGANAVVLKDVPSEATATGIPATSEIRRKASSRSAS